MLPDFPDIKRLLGRKVAASIRAEIDDAPLLADIARHIIHEGDRYTTVREDGSSETRTFQQSTATAEISAEEIRTSGLVAVHRARGRLVEQLRESASRMLIDAVHRATEEVGNVVQGGGRPLSAELILEMLETMELAFAPDGTWEWPTFVGPPGMRDRAASEMERLANEPELNARFEALIERKREKWRVREANRKLVD